MRPGSVACATVPLDHDVPADAPQPPPPLAETPPAPRRAPAEEARTLVAAGNIGTLATLSSDGHPWGSMVSYGTLTDGSPVLLVSLLAEHGRNLQGDARASLVVADPPRGADPMTSGRVTLAGRAERPTGALADAARDAHLAAVPTADVYVDYGDFSLWVLRVERVRWVGGYGRMDSTSGAAYAEATADPTAPAAAGAIAHLNADHADALLAMARGLAGYPDASSAAATAIDRYGMDLAVDTPRGRADARVGFAEPVSAPDGLRAATVELAARARGGA